MHKETPEANPPLTAEELLLVAKLSDADLQAIDATVLANSCDRWQKVAKVVVMTEDALKNRYPSLS